MDARKAASEGIVYNAYETCSIKTSFTLIIVYHFLLQNFHLLFSVVRATCRVQLLHRTAIARRIFFANDAGEERHGPPWLGCPVACVRRGPRECFVVVCVCSFCVVGLGFFSVVLAAFL